MPNKHLFAKNYEGTVKGFLRVNYAGEMGAVRIYNSQIKQLPNTPILHEMLESEIKHFEYFRNISRQFCVPQTLFLPLWKALASVMGTVSAKNSLEDAMLCTQGVETVIENHYQEQIQQLEEILHHYNKHDEFIIKNKTTLLELLANIKIFMAEEVHHKEIGQQNSTMKHIPFTLTKAVTKLAVILSEKT